MAKNEFICDCTAVHEDVVAEVAAKMCDGGGLEKATAFFKVIGDPTRMKILWALNQHELCVCDLANIMSMTKSAISHQLAVLRSADIVRFRRDNRTVYYSLADEHVKYIINAGLDHVNE